MSQVYYNIWLGGYEEGEDKEWLLKNKITHILLCAAELSPKFPKKIKYLQLPVLSKENFDLYPYLDQGADYILKSIEEGTLYIHGYRDESRGPSMLIAFLMKFFGWDYMRCYQTVIKRRPMMRLMKSDEKSCHQYYDEVQRLMIAQQRGQLVESNIISNYTSTLTPCFLKTVTRPKGIKPKEPENTNDGKAVEETGIFF